MAIDKSRTSKGMKVGVIILIIAFVLGIGGIGSMALLPQPPATPATGAGSNAGLQQISQSALAAIAPNEAALKATPDDYALLTTLGNQYFDYAQQVQTAAQGSGVDVTIWQRSADYYRRALAVTPGDPAVGTDMAIAQFYGNDTGGAIASIEAVMVKSPDFAQAPFNAGIFYQSVGDNPKAKAAWEKYLKLEPNGSNAANAKKFLADLGDAPAAPAAPAAAPATGATPLTPPAGSTPATK